jgi:hypothetical protein
MACSLGSRSSGSPRGICRGCCHVIQQWPSQARRYRETMFVFLFCVSSDRLTYNTDNIAASAAANTALERSINDHVDQAFAGTMRSPLLFLFRTCVSTEMLMRLQHKVARRNRRHLRKTCVVGARLCCCCCFSWDCMCS